MPRGPVYTPEEDAILLAHRSTADVIEALREAGYERDSDSIRTRKKLLRARGSDAGALFEQRKQLMYDYRSLRRQRENLERQLIDVNLAIMAAARDEPVESLDEEERNAVVVRVHEILREEDLRADLKSERTTVE